MELKQLLKKVEAVYCDMDGVIADFKAKPNAPERYDKEKGFFKNLQPIETNLLALKKIIGFGGRVYILSTSPNKQADKDKMIWLKKYLKELPKENVIFCRKGKPKTKYVKNLKGALLLDDYSKNLIEWKEKGGLALKVVNNYDNKVGTHTKYNIPYVESLAELV